MYGAPFWASLLLAISLVKAEGNIGCLFANGLCLEELEWCYDDLAFGRCLPKYGPIDEDELYSSPLSETEVAALAGRVASLQRRGYGWADGYTQCRLQSLLWQLRRGVPATPRVCRRLRIEQQEEELAQQDAIEEEKERQHALSLLEAAERADVQKQRQKEDERWPAQQEETQVLPKVGKNNGLEDYPSALGDDDRSPLAYVRFTPSDGSPGGEFADEVYFPPGKSEVDERHKKNNRDIFDFISSENPAYGFSHYMPGRNNYSPDETNVYQQDLPKHIKHKLPIMDSRLSQSPENLYRQQMQNNAANEGFFNYGGQDAVRRWLETQDMEHLKEALEELRQSAMASQDDDQQEMGTAEYLIKNRLPGRFSRQYNTPEGFRMGVETRDHQPQEQENFLVDYDQSTADEDARDQQNLSNDLPEDEVKFPQKSAGVYTEGGLVYVPDSDDDNSDSEKSELLSILGGNSWAGFKRRERLDVKKPGPPAQPPRLDDEILIEPHKPLSLIAMEPAVPLQKKEVAKYHAPHSVDTSYAYVTVKDSIKAWRVGARLVQMLTELLELPQGSLSHPRVDSHEVSFLVEEKAGLNASTIAQKIMSEKMVNTLKNQYGIIVTGSGVGDKAKLPLETPTIMADGNAMNGHLAGFLLGGIGGAVLVAIGAMILIRKHSRAKDKLGSLEGPECGSSKDYQDLCRARMAGKNPGVVEPLIQPQGATNSTRIASLSRESDQNSPSSRSSTSSWSEEPAMTNMDISTGHMVLSYMEDHLRNKGRLDREWGALCRYEAEPGARSAASADTSLPLNRPSAPLPYDHSRVVLNHLSNEAGLDYINASTISDHDPRAPLYVAAQGPLKETAAHFWQMVWEQGAVVMVMLCRLEEEGIEMCYRYWPEEGSQVYHIYEVHLVSEHIWCEDYLVRSFYLKNLRTGETRTVTQFHFLSWPNNGIPSSAKALLEFRRKVNKSYRGRSCPIVVHCSDGAGRSGTYVLLDMVLARMAKGAREIDIAATLEHIRDQRAEMVATRAQFEFVLTAVAEEVHAILKALPANLPDKKDKDKDKDKDKEKDKEKEKEKPNKDAATSEKNEEDKK